jgi:hypothetical protein
MAGRCRCSLPASWPSIGGAHGLRRLRCLPHGADFPVGAGCAPVRGACQLQPHDGRAGQGTYAHLLAEDGGILDDAITFCLGPERFLAVVNAATAGRISRGSSGGRRGSTWRWTTRATAPPCWRCRGPTPRRWWANCFRRPGPAALRHRRAAVRGRKGLRDAHGLHGRGRLRDRGLAGGDPGVLDGSDFPRRAARLVPCGLGAATPCGWRRAICSTGRMPTRRARPTRRTADGWSSCRRAISSAARRCCAARRPGSRKS